MSSMIDAFKETASDKYSMLKIATFAAPVYLAYSEYLKPTVNNANIWNLFYIAMFFLFGFFLSVTSNVINERTHLMPALNPIKLAWFSIRGLLAIGPLAWGSITIAKSVIVFINIIPWLDITLKSIIWLIVASIIATAYMMFAREEKISAAYKMKQLSEKAGDLMVGLIFYVLQLVVINVPTVGLIGYTIYVLFGFSPLLYAFCSYAIIFNVIVTADYMGQMHYEVFGIEKKTL